MLKISSDRENTGAVTRDPYILTVPMEIWKEWQAHWRGRS